MSEQKINREEANLVLHLLLLGELDLGDLRHPLHLHPRAEDLDLVRVHRRVGDQDARVLHALRLVLAGRLVQEKTWTRGQDLSASFLKCFQC